jgi:hypothetical protein
LKRLAVNARLGATALYEALEGSGPLELALDEPPGDVSREALLLSAARRDWPLVVRFEGTLATPLAELAVIATLSEHGAEARLDLRGALLAPFLLRVGTPALARLVLAHGPLLPASSLLLSAHRHEGRSPLALCLAVDLLRAAPRSEANAFAREKAAFAFALASPDRLEGIAAFRGKRAPRFHW